MKDYKHTERVRKQLQEAGLGSFTVLRAECRFLPSIIYHDEKIGAAVYGLGPDGWCLVVATDKRVIYLDKKPFFVTKDILTYDIVSGVTSNQLGMFASVTLLTRGKQYALRFVNTSAAATFTQYIESRRLSGGQYDQRSGRYYEELNDSLVIMDIPNKDATEFIRNNDVGVLSTYDDRDDTVSGAVVHYVLDGDSYLYVLTKSASRKARSVMSNGKSALTIYEPGSMKTAQIQAIASLEADHKKQRDIFDHMIQERSYSEGSYRPPVTSLKEGTYVIVKLTPTSIIFTDYSKENIAQRDTHS